MRAVGMTFDEIVVEFMVRYRLRPRAAWRLAHGWTLTEAASHVNAVAAQLGYDTDGRASMTASRLCEVEQWPSPSGRKPSVHVLALLAHSYGTHIRSLLDLDDHEHLPPADRLLVEKTLGPAPLLPAQPARPCHWAGPTPRLLPGGCRA